MSTAKEINPSPNPLLSFAKLVLAGRVRRLEMTGLEVQLDLAKACGHFNGLNGLMDYT